MAFSFEHNRRLTFMGRCPFFVCWSFLTLCDATSEPNRPWLRHTVNLIYVGGDYAGTREEVFGIMEKARNIAGSFGIVLNVAHAPSPGPTCEHLHTLRTTTEELNCYGKSIGLKRAPGNYHFGTGCYPERHRCWFFGKAYYPFSRWWPSRLSMSVMREFSPVTKEYRGHRAALTVLHEIFHTLGAHHDDSGPNIMQSSPFTNLGANGFMPISPKTVREIKRQVKRENKRTRRN